MKEDEFYENFTLANYSVKELEVFMKIAEEKQDRLIQDWAKELGEILKQKGFDQYSKKGEKVIDKFTKKHAEKLSDVLTTISMIDEELGKRENYNYQRRFIDDNVDSSDEELTTEDFIKREQEKINDIRKYLDD